MSINPITMMMFQPLGALEAQNGLNNPAVAPAATDPPAAAETPVPAAQPPAAEPEKDTAKLVAGDTIWALVKDRLGPDATDREIFNATEKVLKANGQTWESAKKMRAGQEVDFSVLSEGQTPAAPPAEQPRAAADPAVGQPLGALEAQGVQGTGLPLGALEAQQPFGLNTTPQAPFTGSPLLDNLLFTTFGSLDPSVQQFLPFSTIG